MKTPAFFRTLFGLLIWIELAAHGEEDGCPAIFMALPVDQLRQEAISYRSISIFSLLVEDSPFLSKGIRVSGMLINGHGRTFLVPASSRDYLFTDDCVKIENSRLPGCLLEKLDGSLFW